MEVVASYMILIAILMGIFFLLPVYIPMVIFPFWYIWQKIKDW